MGQSKSKSLPKREGLTRTLLGCESCTHTTRPAGRKQDPCQLTGGRSSRPATWWMWFLLEAFAACAPTFPPPRPEQVAVAVVVADVSNSADLSRRCSEVAAQVRSTFAIEADHFDVLAFATGDKTSAYEPIPLVRWATYSEEAILFETPDASASKADGFIRVVQEECARNLVERSESPIHRAITRGVEAIRARCVEVVQAGGVCGRKQLDVLSDMLEGVEPSLREALGTLRTPAKRPHQAKLSNAPPPAPVLVQDNDGISFHVCGIAQTGGDTSVVRRPAAIPASRLYEAWAPLLGTAAPRAFAPVCKAEPAPESTLSKEQSR